MSKTPQNAQSASDDKALWVAIRRGALLVSGAIERFYSDDPFWVEVRRGIGVIVSAIETRYNLTRG